MSGRAVGHEHDLAELFAPSHGRVRLAHTAIGYGEKWLDSKVETYANTAKASLDAFSALVADVRAGRQIKG